METKTVEVRGYYGGDRTTKVRVRGADEHGGWISKGAYKGAIKRLGLSDVHYQTLRVVGESRGYTITVEPNFALIR